MADDKFIPPEVKKSKDGFVPPEVKKKGETIPEDSTTPAAKPSLRLPGSGETTRVDQKFQEAQQAKQKELYAPETQVTETVSTRVEEPTIISEEALAGADPLFTGGSALENQEQEAVDKRMRTQAKEVFGRLMNIEGRRGIPYEEEDIPKSMEELQPFRNEAKREYEVLMSSKLYNHVPDDLKAKAKISLKQRDLYKQLKSKDLSPTERMEAMEKLRAIDTELKDFDYGKQLYDPITEQYVDQDKATPAAEQYEDKVQSLVQTEYSDLEKTYKASEKALHLHDYYEDERNKKLRTDEGVVYQNLTYKDLDNPGMVMSLKQNYNIPDQEFEKAILLKERWIESKANVEAISRAIMLNEDPSQVERGFFGDAGFSESVGKGFMEAIGEGQTTTGTEGDFATRFVDVINKSGEQGLLTKKQVENAKSSFTEKLGYGVGASLPIMAEIAVATAVTEGVGTIPAVAKHLANAKKIFGTTKAGKLLGNVVEQGAKGYITFAPTEETGATGVGEGVVQGALDTFLPEKLLGGKYGKILNLAIRTGAGATGETLQELAGQYTEALSENGYNAEEAFEEAFGRTPEERWENLALIGATSLLFSGAFNSTRLVQTREALQSEIDNGKVPAEDVEAAQEIVDNIDQKIKSDSEEPNVPTPVEEEIKEAPEKVVSKEEVKVETPESEVKATKVETKKEEDAVQIKEPAGVSVQPEAGVSEKVEEGKPEPGLEEPTKKEEEKEIQKEDVKPEPGIEERPEEQEAGRVADIDTEAREAVKKKASPEEKRQFAIDAVETGQIIERGKGKNILAREDFGMPNKEIDKAINDIKKGNYETAPAKRLIGKLEDAYESGTIPVIEGTGGKSVRERGIPVTSIVEDIAKAKKVDTKESLIEELNTLQKGSSTTGIYKRIKSLGIENIPEIKELVSEKAKEYKEYQKEIRQEFGIDEEGDIPLPFQKKSTKPIAGKRYLGDMIKTLQKSIKGLEVEFDESIDELGTIRDGKIIINPKKASTDTPIHEFGHVWTKLLKSKNNILYKAGTKLVSENQELMDFIRTSRPDLKTEEQIIEEALVTAIGEKGEEHFKTEQQKNKLRKVLDKVAKAIKRFFGIKKSINWRDISEMNLKDFTKLASEELLSETPLTSVTEQDVKNIMSEKLILDTITIDSDILTGKGLNTIGKVKEGLKGAFYSAGKLPKWVSNLDSNTRSAVNATMSNAAADVKVFNKLLKEHIKENDLKKKEVGELLEGINDVFIGDRTVNSLGLDQNEDLALGIAAMRDGIDKLSTTLVNSGYIKGDAIATINENIGMYIRRSYEIHQAKPKGFDEWTNSLPPEVVAKAKEFIVSEFELARINKFRFINKDNGNYDVVMINEFGMESPSQEMSRDDLIAVLSEEKQKKITDGNVKELEADTGEVTLTDNVDPKKYGIVFEIKEEDVNKQISDILSKHLSKENSFGAAGLNKKDISILKKRKDIPKEIRDLLGEIKDPVANYMETVTKMASYIEYSKFLNRLKQEGEGTVLWSKEDRPDKTVKISAEKNPRWAPIDGMYTTKEFMDALEHFERDGALDWKSESAKYAYGMVMYLNTLTKTALTKWNIPSNFRNHYGAMMMAARLGYANPVKFAKSYADYWKGIKSTDSKNFDRAEFDMMKSYGMIDDGVGYQTYKDSLRRAMKTAPALRKAADRFSDSTPGKIANAPRDFMDKVYLAPDAAAKVYVFRSMKKDYAKAYPDLTEDQLNEKVANIVKDTMPTYSKMSKAAKSLSRNPLVGAFASFTTETVRNVVNQVSLIKQEYSEAKETGNEELMKLAKKKVTGLSVMMLAIPTMATALRLALGIDNDDEEALRSVKAPWEKNAWTLYLGEGKDGQISTVDLSYTDPLSVFSKPLYAFLNGIYSDDKNAVDAAAQSLAEARDQFLGEEPMFGALSEAFVNKDSFGKPIAQPLKNEEWKRAAHVLDVMKPKFIDTFTDIAKVASEENESEFGRKYEPLTYGIYTMGVRVKKTNVLNGVKFKIGREISDVYDAKNIYKYSEDKTQEDLDKANIELAKIFKEHSLNIEAARVLGASEKEIRKSLNEKNKNGKRWINKDWVNQLLNEQFIPITHDSDKKRRRVSPKKSSTLKSGISGGGSLKKKKSAL